LACGPHQPNTLAEGRSASRPAAGRPVAGCSSTALRYLPLMSLPLR